MRCFVPPASLTRTYRGGTSARSRAWVICLMAPASSTRTYLGGIPAQSRTWVICLMAPASSTWTYRGGMPRRSRTCIICLMTPASSCFHGHVKYAFRCVWQSRFHNCGYQSSSPGVRRGCILRVIVTAPSTVHPPRGFAKTTHATRPPRPSTAASATAPTPSRAVKRARRCALCLLHQGRDVVHRPGAYEGDVHPRVHDQDRAQGCGGRVPRRGSLGREVLLHRSPLRQPT